MHGNKRNKEDDLQYKEETQIVTMTRAGHIFRSLQQLMQKTAEENKCFSLFQLSSFQLQSVWVLFHHPLLNQEDAEVRYISILSDLPLHNNKDIMCINVLFSGRAVNYLVSVPGLRGCVEACESDLRCCQYSYHMVEYLYLYELNAMNKAMSDFAYGSRKLLGTKYSNMRYTIRITPPATSSASGSATFTT